MRDVWKFYAAFAHTNLHNPVLEELHRDVSYKHSHLLGPGHSFTATVVVGDVDAARTQSGVILWQGHVKLLIVYSKLHE